MASWKNRATVADILKRTPAVVKAAVARQLKTEVDDLTEAVRRAAPVGSDIEDRAGQLRESVHNLPGRRELQHVVTVDAKDKHGHFIALHVELGHKAADGSHVSALPFLFPTYRARKPGMRRRIMAAARAAIRQHFGI